MDMSAYLNLFLGEAREYLQSFNEALASLEETVDRPTVDLLFRAAHSLKGMAATMELLDIVAVAHNMEDLMIRVRDQGLELDTGATELLFEGTELMAGLLDDVELGVGPRRPLGDLPGRLAAYRLQQYPPSVLETQLGVPQPGTAGEAPAEGETREPAQQAPVPLADAKGAPQAPRAAAAPANGAADSLSPAAGGISTVRVRTEVLDHLVNLTGELITNKHRLLNVGQEVASQRLNDALAETNKLLRSLHDEVMQVRLLPFDAICDRFQRSVRALGKKSGKDLQLEIEGRDIGLDRAILEQLVDPLNHLLRNAVDHGIESAEERTAAGKPARGTVRLAVSRDRDRIVITVTDDGRGMEAEKLVASALKKGLIGAEEAQGLTTGQALMLCCIPGFSTACEVSEVSGRGVGMDAVNASVIKLGGTLSIDSEAGRGSRFSLRLPVTIAIIHALLVKCDRFKIAIPVSAVHRSLELHRAEVEKLGKRRVFRLNDEVIPLLSLNRVLGVPAGRARGGLISLFITQAKGRRVGIVVDRLLGQHELFVKPLGRPLGKLPGVEGGATLGDGEIVTVLNVAEII